MQRGMVMIMIPFDYIKDPFANEPLFNNSYDNELYY